LIKAERQRSWFAEPLATLSLSASAAAAAAAAASLTTDPLAAEDLLLSWYSLYQPRPQPAAPGPMLAAMSTLMMPAAAMTLAGHPLSALPAPHHPKPQDLLTLPGPLPIAHLTLKAMNGHNSAAAQQALANGLALGAAAGNNLCLTSSSMVGTSSNSNKAEHFHIFVGDLSPEIETHTLRDAFAAFGEISDCRVVRDPQTLKSKGYGFVSFVKKTDAENAIAGMNGQWLGTRAIRTNWATRKPPAPKDAASKPLSYDEVFGQSSSTNCTVYCGNLAQGTTEEALQKTFAPYGQIQEIRVFKDKGYAFIRFASKESATQAIVSVHNSDVNGQNVKCSWGKEPGEPGNTSNAQLMTGGLGPTNTQYPYGYNQGMGYWYPSGYPPQMQSQFVQGMQGYAAYGQFGYQPGMSMQLPGGWQGVPAQGGGGAQMSGQQMAAAAAVSQQGGMVASYPIQQFQAQ